MAGAKSILLLESDEEVISDVTTSLRLVNIPLTVARTVNEAKRAAITHMPPLVMVRVQTQGDPDAAIHLAHAMSDHSELKEIPLVALCTSSERSKLEGYSSLFKGGELLLPVTFPNFAQGVQDAILRLVREGYISLGAPVAEQPEAEEPEEEEEVQIEPAAKVTSTRRQSGVEHAGTAVDSDIEDRVLLTYKIQTVVFEALRDSGALRTANIEDIPRIVAELTSKVCAKVTL